MQVLDLRVDITEVDADGKIVTFQIHDPGAGYTTNERIEVRLMSNIGSQDMLLVVHDSTITELATTEALREVNSQTLRLIGVGDSDCSISWYQKQSTT